MPITPMFHVHAWGIPYVATALGIKQVYPGRYLPDVLLDLIKREKVTFSHCVPTILHMLLSSPAAGSVDLSGWKVIIGGSALPKGLAKLAMDRGIYVFTGYGMSETCPIMSLAQLKPPMTALDADQQIDYCTKSGMPIQLVDLRVVDEQMRDVPYDGQASGEVVARAPWLTQGYLNDPANSEQLWRGGYLHTSDIGTINQQGYLQITDRIKDVVKSGGEWISSLAIEDLISQYSGVSVDTSRAISTCPASRRRPFSPMPSSLLMRKPGMQGPPGTVAGGGRIGRRCCSPALGPRRRPCHPLALAPTPLLLKHRGRMCMSRRK